MIEIKKCLDLGHLKAFRTLVLKEAEVLGETEEALVETEEVSVETKGVIPAALGVTEGVDSVETVGVVSVVTKVVDPVETVGVMPVVTAVVDLEVTKVGVTGEIEGVVLGVAEVGVSGVIEAVEDLAESTEAVHSSDFPKYFFKGSILRLTLLQRLRLQIESIS